MDISRHVKLLLARQLCFSVVTARLFQFDNNLCCTVFLGPEQLFVVCCYSGQLLAKYLCVWAVSHHFGYGLLDVAAMVDVARNWTRVPEQHRCEITSRHASRLTHAASLSHCRLRRQ